MSERTYPRMSYHESWPKVGGQVVHNADQDVRLGHGWDDPYGVRSDIVSTVEPVELTATPVERKKPGRKPKVQG